MNDPTPYQCPFCETRFSTHYKLEEHWIDDHGFIPTTFSHTARYWRHFHNPRTECELKFEAIKTWYQNNNQSFIVDWDALSEILGGSEFKENSE